MRIVVADDHPLYREALCARLQRIFPDASIDESSSLDEAVTAALNEPPQLFLLDYNMPGMAPDALGALIDSHPGSRVALISGTAEAAEVRESVRAGAHGFIPKTATPDQLQLAIQMIMAGGTSVPTQLLVDAETASRPAPNAEPDWLHELSERETEVFRALARGLSNKQIGRELGLAEVTVKLHVSSIFRKTGVHCRSEAAVLAASSAVR